MKSFYFWAIVISLACNHIGDIRRQNNTEAAIDAVADVLKNHKKAINELIEQETGQEASEDCQDFDASGGIEI